MGAPLRRSRLRQEFVEGSEINLTPLLDVIFNLIFFFILGTTIREKTNFFELVLPESSQAPATEVVEVIPEIAVSADGTIALDGEVLPREIILQQLKDKVERLGTTRAILSAEGQATVNQTTAATDLLYEAGIRDLMQRVKRSP